MGDHEIYQRFAGNMKFLGFNWDLLNCVLFF